MGISVGVVPICGLRFTVLIGGTDFEFDIDYVVCFGYSFSSFMSDSRKNVITS